MTKRNRIPSGQLTGGFTLVELIVVIIILGILALMVIPNMSNSDSLKARAAARMVMADLEYAQSQAIVSQQQTTITFNVPADSYTVSNASGPLIHPITKNTYAISLNQGSGMNNVTIASAGFGAGSAVTFDALGAPDNSGTISIVAGATTYYVAVAPVTGRITAAEAP